MFTADSASGVISLNFVNLLSIEYYRTVDKSGAGLWSEVYAKVPFNKDELASFGGIFGALRLSGKSGLTEHGARLIGEIDKYISEPTNKGNLVGLIGLLEKYRAEGIFGWVDLNDDGERVIKVGGRGKIRARLVRGEKETILRDEGSTKVVTGKLMMGDKLTLATNDWGASLALEVRGVEEVEEERTQEDTPGVSTSHTPGVGDREGSKWAESEIEAERLVSDRVVGGVGIKGKVASAKMGLVNLTEKWRGGIHLAGADRQKRHRWVLVLGSVFLVALAVSVGLGLIKTRRDKLEAGFKAVYEPWEQKRKEAEVLFVLNPVGARELLRSVRDELAASKVKFAEGPFEGKINEFEKSLEASWAKVSGEVRVSPELFYNLGLIRTNLLGSRLAFNDKKLIVLDEKLGIMAEVDYQDQKSSVVLGKGEGLSWIDLAGFKNNLVVLTKTGLVAKLSDKRVEQTFDGSVSEPVAVDVFGTVAYVLDRGVSEIWRFGLSDGVISERRRWLSAGVEADLKSGLDLALDGDIFVLLADGKVMRLRRGEVEKYGLTDLPIDFRPERVTASAEANVLAFLDSKKSRVVLFNKETGAYVRQLLALEFGKAMDLVLVNGKTLIVLVEGKLLKVSI